jgi:hypothetical protein
VISVLATIFRFDWALLYIDFTGFILKRAAPVYTQKIKTVRGIEMTSKNLTILLLLALTSVPALASEKRALEWQIKKPVWTKAHEKSYEEFVATLGKGKKAGHCHTTNDCIKNPIANPRYYNLNPIKLKDVFADCADLPYVLRAYFSWMNNLPFSYPVRLSPASPQNGESQRILAEIRVLQSQLAEAGFFNKRIIQGKIKDLQKQLNGGKTGDIRYNRFGNNIVEKRYVKNGVSINTVLTEVGGSISTASFRTNASNNTTGQLFRDTYPVEISKAAIKPGTILYDPNGHIAVVYEVTKNGKIHLIDAHPDNSLTAITYGEKFSRTSVEVGGGFSNWRPFSYENGAVQATPNEQLADYSLEQFQKGTSYVFNDKKVSFYEYVRNKLSAGALVYKPVEEITELLGEICYDVKERNLAVNASLATNIQNRSHPGVLPENIYGTDGDWENYSSPSRDARLKASIREGRSLIIKMIEGYKNSDPSIQYNGVDLVGDMKRAYDLSINKCTFAITKTNGSAVSLNLDNILKNIYKLSFDPYHCIELRWGMTDAESLKSCAQSKEKLEWYNAEQGLRNRIDRDYSMKMDYGLSELAGAPISNVLQEDISLEKVLK